jgi:hypothetical protein
VRQPRREHAGDADRLVLVAVPPDAPTLPSTAPAPSLISTAPVCGRKAAVRGRARVTKKFGLSLARCARIRLAAPMPTAAHALPVAMSTRNMLAPSSRRATLRWPDASSTATAIGRCPAARAARARRRRCCGPERA